MEKKFELHYKKLKRNKLIKRIVSAVLAGVVLSSIGYGIYRKNHQEQSDDATITPTSEATAPITTNKTSINNNIADKYNFEDTSISDYVSNENIRLEKEKPAITSGNYETVDFKAIRYANKYYLTIDEQDLYYIIEDAMNEVDDEYTSLGATPVFSTKDTLYSCFTPADIMAILNTETNLRLIELENNKNLFDVNNYKNFSAEHKGIVYNGLGMMNVDGFDTVAKDRELYGKKGIEVNGENVSLDFDLLSAYNYVQNALNKKKPTSQEDIENTIKEALVECIIYNTKSVYILTNRIAKNEIRLEDNSEKTQKIDTLSNYSQLKKLDEIELQKFYTFLAYNIGVGDAKKAVTTGTLFDTTINKNGEEEYIYNIKYPKNIMVTSHNFGTIYSNGIIMN